MASVLDSAAQGSGYSVAFRTLIQIPALRPTLLCDRGHIS